MTNVDTNLNTTPEWSPSALKNDTPKRGLRGAAGGVYIGPVRPNSTSHATGAAAGGVEDTSGYRESDTFDASGGSGGAIGAGGATVTSVSRPTGRTAYIAHGVPGGSTPGTPVDQTGRAVDTGVDRFGRTMGHGTAAGEGHLTYTNFGNYSNTADSGEVAGGGRGTIDTGTGPADTVAGETVARVPAGLIRPGTSGSANPSAGTVSIISATGKVQADLHADDITSGANGLIGAEIILFKRGTNTSADGAFVARGTFDSTTAGDVTGLTGLTAATYAAYARFRQAGGAVGPWSARTTVVVS